MAVQPAMYLAISDGTTTVTIADGTVSALGVPGSTNYPLVRDQWAPNVATVKQSLLGGNKYTDVIEEIVIHIKGVDEATLYSSVQTLNNLLEQATRWAKGEKNATPVVIKYVPRGSTLHSNSTPLQALILGIEPGNDTSSVGLPVTFNNTDLHYYILNVRIRFKRRGLWLGATESASAAAAANPSVLVVIPPSSPSVPGALQVDFTGFTTVAGTGDLVMPSTGYLIVCASPTTAINVQQADSPVSTSLAASLTATSTVDGTTRASGGNFYRLDYVGVAVDGAALLRYELPAAMQSAKRIGVFLNYRNNTASDYTISAQGWKVVDRFALSTPEIYIAATASDPAPLFLGILANNYGFDTIQITVRRGATITGAQTFDIDTVVFVDMDSPYCHIISFDIATKDLVLGASYASKSVNLTIKNDPLTQRVAQLYVDILTTGLLLDGSYYGDLGLLGKGAGIYCLWYCTHAYGGTVYWTTQNNAGSAILNIGATVTRRLGYLTPQ